MILLRKDLFFKYRTSHSYEQPFYIGIKTLISLLGGEYPTKSLVKFKLAYLFMLLDKDNAT